MTMSDVWYGIGDLLGWTLQILQENAIGNILNYTFMATIAFGLLYWLSVQKKLSDKAAKDPNQLK